MGTYYYVFPTFAQGKRVIWDGMDGDGFRFLNHFPRELWSGTPNSTEMKLKLKNGSVFQIVGSDNIDRIVGTNPIGVVFSEFALQDPRAWQFIRPILAENGGWAIFNSTPRGRYNHFYADAYRIAERSDNWFLSHLSAQDTGYPTEEEIERERRDGMSEELIQQEFYTSFTGGMQGAYYVREMEAAESEKRMLRNLYDPELPVDTWWDLGVGDSTVIIFVQTHFNEIRIVDYYESSGEGLQHYAKQVAEKPYIYRDHIAPHDITVRELGTGKSRLEMARNLGIKFQAARKLPVDDGIAAVRMMLPSCYFDKDKAAHLIEALLSYRKEWNDKERMYRDRPHHDWSSHPADAFRTGAVGRRRAKLPEKRERYEIRYTHNQGSWMSA